MPSDLLALLALLALFAAVPSVRDLVLTLPRLAVSRIGRWYLSLLSPAPESGQVCPVCRSVRLPGGVACYRGCRSDGRSSVVEEPMVASGEVIPPRVSVPTGGAVYLVHDPRSHTSGLRQHWSLIRQGAVLGSAADRQGATSLLRAIEGTDVVWLDLLDQGLRAYALTEAIAAFEAGPLPYRGACPERRSQAPALVRGRASRSITNIAWEPVTPRERQATIAADAADPTP